MKKQRREFLQATALAIAAIPIGATGGLARAQDVDDEAQNKAQSKDAASQSPKEITSQTITEAEKLIGLTFSNAEQKQIADTASYQVGIAQDLRALHPTNQSASPATQFDPRLPGAPIAHNDPFAWRATEVGALPKSDEDLAFAPLTHLAEWIRTRQVTSRHVTEVYLDRLDRLAPQLHCMITVTADLARRQADQVDQEIATGQYRGPLHGVPYGAKDLLDTRDVYTTWGAAPYKDRIPTDNAAVIGLLREAGAVLLGKTSMGALAWDDLWFGGRTRNPWNLEEGSSGSSAGSAAGVAAGLMAFAIGTETYGSLSSPATRTGCVGLRPSFGRVPRFGAMTLCWSLDKIGPLCRNVEDSILVLNALNAYDTRDPGSIEIPLGYESAADVAGLRLGYIPRWLENPWWVDPSEAAENGRVALDAAQAAGLELVELDMPELPYDSLNLIIMAEAAAAFEELTLSGRDDLLSLQTSEGWPNSFRSARFISAVDLLQAQRFRRVVMELMHSAFQGIDAIIAPGMSSPLLLVTNLTGQPELTLRSGFKSVRARRDSIGGDMGFAGPPSDKEYSVPMSLSLWAPLFEDGKLCQIGKALERQLDVAYSRPPLFDG